MIEWLKKKGYSPEDAVTLGIATSAFVPGKGQILSVGYQTSALKEPEVLHISGLEATGDITKNTGVTQAMLDSGVPEDEARDILMEVTRGKFLVTYSYETFLRKWVDSRPLSSDYLPEAIDVQVWTYYLDTYAGLPEAGECIADVHEHIVRVIPKRIGNFDTHCYEKTGWSCPGNYAGTGLDKRLEQTWRMWQVLKDRIIN